MSLSYHDISAILLYSSTLVIHLFAAPYSFKSASFVLGVTKNTENRVNRDVARFGVASELTDPWPSSNHVDFFAIFLALHADFLLEDLPGVK